LALVTVLVLGVFALRLLYVQGFAGSALADEALNRRLVTTTLPADRGQILDTKGVVLATSVERFNVIANQQEIAKAKKTTAQGEVLASGPEAAAAVLAPVLGITAPELGARLVGDRAYVVLKKSVTAEVWQQIAALRVAGITAEQTSERVYPAGNVAGNVIGFTGSEGTGLAGIELTNDKTLSGHPGEWTYERGATGQQIPSGAGSTTPAVPGSSVQLTIDRDLQWKAQESLDAQVKATGADWGVVVAMDVGTGDVLALADSGTVDPNSPGTSAGAARGSRAVSNVFEPGSTAKVVTMAALLETGIATPTSQFTVPYAYTTPNNQTFHDSHEHPDLKLTLAGILARSSNAGTVMVGQNLPQQVRYDYLSKFGFGTATGLGLPGESNGILHPVDQWDGRTKYGVLFGQGVSVNAIQATQVYATVANGGVRVQPHIIKDYVDSNGIVTAPTLAEPARVVSASTSAQLMQMLEGAVDDGTGGLAAIPGYRVAGKTGTAQVSDGHGGMTGIVASFIGVAPADKPRIVVSVILSNPRSSIWGGDVAAPVFKDVASYALQYLGVPPSAPAPPLFPVTWN
jgi:cell division protein FtsI (penicillin-binding protein 3)